MRRGADAVSLWSVHEIDKYPSLSSFKSARIESEAESWSIKLTLNFRTSEVDFRTLCANVEKPMRTTGMVGPIILEVKNERTKSGSTAAYPTET